MRNSPPPLQSLAAEQFTLGAMLMERDTISRAAELLSADDFYRELHKKIYKAVLKLFDNGEPINRFTVAEELRGRGQLADVGGSQYLSALIEGCPSSTKIEDYARAVKEYSALRQLLKSSDEMNN